MVTCGVLGSSLRPSWLTLPWFGPTHASLDALSSDLAAYAKSQGDDMGVVVYDITHNRYYSYNDSTPFLLASSAKVPIMLSYLDLVESQNRQPTTSETQLLTRMITVSDNDAAQALFQARGWNAGQAQYLQKIGVSGYQPNANGWGWATLPPRAWRSSSRQRLCGQRCTGRDHDPGRDAHHRGDRCTSSRTRSARPRSPLASPPGGRCCPWSSEPGLPGILTGTHAGNRPGHGRDGAAAVHRAREPDRQRRRFRPPDGCAAAVHL